MRERRKHIRHDIRYKVVCSSLGNPARKFTATSYNISFGGIGISLKKFIKEAERLKIDIFSPYQKAPLRAKARLIWQSRFPGLMEKRAGLEFTEIPWSAIKSVLSETA